MRHQHRPRQRWSSVSLQIQLLSTKDKGRPWPQFIHDFEVNCSKEAQLLARSKQMMIPVYSGSAFVEREYVESKEKRYVFISLPLSQSENKDSLEAVNPLLY